MSKVSKTSRKSSKASQASDEVIKDDGTRWIVVSQETGKAIYGEKPIPKADALRLAEGLVSPATIQEVQA